MNHLLSKIGSYPFEKLNLLHKDIKPSKDVINLSIGEPKLNADSKVLDILKKETNTFSNNHPMNAVQEISEELPEAAVEATAATEDAVEAEQVEDEPVVLSIAPAEPEEDWNFFF